MLERLHTFIGNIGVGKKLGAAFLGLTLIPVAIFAHYSINLHAHLLEKQTIGEIEHNILTVSHDLTSVLTHAADDIVFLASIREVQNYFDALHGLPHSKRVAMLELQQEATLFLSQKAYLFQVQFLDRAGVEHVRICKDKQSSKVKVLSQSPSALPFSYYLYAIDGLSPGEYLIHPGELALPDQKALPVVQIIYPFFQKDAHLRGIIVASMPAEIVFQPLERFASAPGIIGVVNEEGQYVFHTKKKANWAQMLAARDEENLKHDYPEHIVSAMLSDESERGTIYEHSVISYRVVSSMRGRGDAHRYVIFREIPNDIVFAPVQSFYRFSALLIFIFLGVALGTAYIITKNITSSLKQANEVAEHIGAGRFDLRSPVKRGDEFGGLLSRLGEVASALSERDHRIMSQQKELDVILSTMNDGVAVIEPGLEISYMNRVLQKQFGDRRGERCYEVFCEATEPCAECAIKDALGDAQRLSFFRQRDRSGRVHEIVFSRLERPTGVVAVLEIRRDVTQEVTLEAQLRQAQKMEAIGTLAGGVAHDFNNILTSIIGFAQLAILEENLSPLIRKYISKIPEQGKRAAQLITQLLTFSRRTVTEKQPLYLLPLIKETTKMLERTLPEHIAVQVDTSGEVATVNADPTQMQQVIMNLCINAGQAMPNGGELTLSLEDVTLDEAYCRQYAYARPGHYVCLSVRDTGVGMTPEVQERIFEPFFTTKGVGKGTGLGLAMVYGIVKTHEGHINVYSEVGKGSEFKVYLPAMAVETTWQVVSAEERLVGGNETLLLVEDDAMALATGQAILERLGYTVLTATDGEEALEVYRTRQSEIALVLTDMVMPRMSGKDLYEALRQIDAEVKALLVSGYSLTDEVAALRMSGLKGFVQKPFDLHKLGQVVRETLDRG